jgi:flagellar biosynthesis protein FliQ/type III secretory pathway component EscR
VTPPATALPGATAPAVAGAAPAASVPGTPFRLNIGLEGAGQTGEVSVALQIVIIMTLLSVAPSIVLLMTSFTRIVIVLGFVRTALGTPSAPSNQIVVGLSLFLTLFLMGPVIDRVNSDAIRPYLDGKITSIDAIDRASVPLKQFMLKQTRTRDLEYFLQRGHPGFRAERAADGFPDGLSALPAFPGHRLPRLERTDGARHDDDAAHHDRAPAQAAAVRARRRLAPRRPLPRPEFRRMNPDLAIDLFKSTVMFSLYIVAPFLGLTLVVGLLASILQSVTSMQEQTLTFIPKIVAVAGLVMVLSPWLLRTLSEFTITIITRMGTLGH